MSQRDTVAPAATFRGGSRIAWVVLIGLVALVAAGVMAASLKASGSNGSNADSPAGSAQAVVAAWMVPVGFTRAPNDGSIAYRWMEAGEFSCDAGDRCLGMEVVAQLGCPRGLYVELTTLANDGAAVGLTSDAVASIRAGGAERMVFGAVDGTATAARIGDISCH